jgi:zinc knuckle protein
MASGRPFNMSPVKWYEMARTVDDNRATNEAFQSAYRAPTASAGRSNSILPVRSAPSFPNANLVPTPGNPILMDIDLAQRKALPSASCFRCRKPGHFSKECPDRFDVWTLSIDELQELLEDKLAQLDVATPDPLFSILEESVDVVVCLCVSETNKHKCEEEGSAANTETRQASMAVS